MLDGIKNLFLHLKSDIQLVFVKIVIPKTWKTTLEGKNRVFE